MECNHLMMELHQKMIELIKGKKLIMYKWYPYMLKNVLPIWWSADYRSRSGFGVRIIATYQPVNNIAQLLTIQLEKKNHIFLA